MNSTHIKTVNELVDDNEYLYRGIVEVNWNYERNIISSAAFKDSKGTSVDRDNGRNINECVQFLNSKKDFFAVARILSLNVREIEAFIEYLPLDDNIYHSEIHDSKGRPQIRSSKASKIRDKSEIVFRK